MLNKTFTARRVSRHVPIWTLYVDGVDFGTLTHLPMEKGPMATIRAGGQTVTLTGVTVAEVLGMAKVSFALLEAVSPSPEYRTVGEIIADALADDQPDEEPIEDEDGTLAAMRAAERLAEVWAERDPTYGFPDYY